MVKRRPSGDGMVRKRDDGRWEGRIVVGHKKNGDPIFHHDYANTQKELTDKLHQSIERYQDVELTEEDLAAPDEEPEYWLIQHGWSHDDSIFCPGSQKEPGLIRIEKRK